MPIQVVCPGCKKRFQVSEKFAGKQGPCPNCKGIIKIPEKAEQVTIHAPDEVKGPDGKTVSAQPTFKPIRRTHLSASPVAIVSIVGGVIMTLVIALVIRMSTDPENTIGIIVLAPAALLISVPIAWGGYIFVRDPELGGYQGAALYIRIGICALIYVGLWGVWTFLRFMWGFPPGKPIDIYWLAAIVPAMIAIGALVPFSTFDLDYTTAALHYGFYLGICVLLRVIMHLPPL